MLVFTKKSDLSAFLSPLINQKKNDWICSNNGCFARWTPVFARKIDSGK